VSVRPLVTPRQWRRTSPVEVAEPLAVLRVGKALPRVVEHLGDDDEDDDDNDDEE
jgi:hypothetical protein